MGNFSALIVMMATLFLIFGNRRSRQSGGVRAALLLVFLAHQAAALCNAFFFDLPGSGADSNVFYKAALHGEGNFSPLRIGEGKDFYVWFLTRAFGVLGESKFLGIELSVLAFCLAGILLAELAYLMNLGQFAPRIVFCWGLTPSLVVYTSAMLRESWQILFLLLAVYTLFSMRAKPNAVTLAAFLASCFFLAHLHKGLALLSVLLMILGALFVGLGGRYGSGSRLHGGHPALFLVQLSLGGLLLIAGITWFKVGEEASAEVITAVSTGKTMDYVQDYRNKSADDARANYGLELDSSSLAGVAKTLPLIILMYFFAPLPWQIGEFQDAIAFVEILFRTVLLCACLAAMLQARGERRTQLQLLLATFLIIECMWAAGTVNWGPAARHRTVAYFIPYLIGLPALALRGRLPAEPWNLDPPVLEKKRVRNRYGRQPRAARSYTEARRGR